MTKRILFLFWLLSAWELETYGQVKYAINIERIGVQELSSIIVRSAPDRYGKMWFSTFSGISMYDGYTFRSYKPDRTNPNAISDASVVGLLPDSKNRIWVSFNGQPVVNYLYQNTFVKDIKWGKTVQSRQFGDFFETKDQTIWLSSGDGLLKYDEAQKTFDRIPPHILAGIKIRGLVEDAQGNLWLGGSSHQLFCYNRRTHSVRAFPLAPTNHDIRSIKKEGDVLWIGVRGEQGGFLKFDLRTHQVSTFATLFPQPLTQIASLAVEGNGIIWVADYGTGLYRVDTFKNQVQHFQQDVQSPEGLSTNDIYSLHIHRNNLWITTNLGGLQKINLRQFDLPTYTFDSGTIKYSQSQLAPISSFQSKDGRLWIGTFRGLIQLLPQYDEKDNTKRFKFNKHILKDLKILEINEHPSQKLWISTDKSLYELNTTTNQIKTITYKPNPLTQQEVLANFVFTEKGTVYLTNTTQLLRFDPQNAKFFPVQQNASILPLTMFQDRDKGIWVSTKEHIYRFDPEKNTFTQQFGKEYQYGASKFYQDSKGKIWVSTSNSGLWIIDPEKNTISPFEHVLPKSFYAATVIEDRFGNIWIGTHHHALFRYNPQTKQIIRWSVGDGALSLYNLETLLTLQNGNLLLGGVGGFQEIDPSQIRTPFAPDLLLEQGNGNVLMNGGTMHFDDPNAALWLKVLDYASPTENRCYYKLDDVENAWTACGQGFIQLNTLGGMSGTHTLFVKGTNSAGMEKSAQFQLITPIVWWKRVWVWVLMFGLSSLGIWSFFKWRELRAKERALAIQNTIEEARQEERNELASWIHDIPLSDLVGTRFVMSDIKRSIQDQRGEKAFATLDETLQDVRKTLRNMCSQLQIPGLENGLSYAIQLHAKIFEEIYPNIQVHLDLPDDHTDSALPLQTRKNLYLIYRTAMNNIAKHAQATEVRITLLVEEPIILRIHDNGVGFSEQIDYQKLRENKQFGLFLAFNHAKTIGGTLSIENDHGTLMNVIIP